MVDGTYDGAKVRCQADHEKLQKARAVRPIRVNPKAKPITVLTSKATEKEWRDFQGFCGVRTDGRRHV